MKRYWRNRRGIQTEDSGSSKGVSIGEPGRNYAISKIEGADGGRGRRSDIQHTLSADKEDNSIEKSFIEIFLAFSYIV